MDSNPGRTALLTLSTLLVFAGPVKAYGPAGHEIVGAIADERLANTPAGREVNALLTGITLEKAAVIADEIKGWDKRGVDDPKTFRYRSHPQIDEQLAAFWRANQPTHDPNSPNPSHHWFHYTDVPIVPAQKYATGKAGRSQWDIVHMIPFCVDVLRGRIPESNERHITRPIAVILLAHYLGDIHQPLHVGADYFDAAGHTADPDKDKTTLADEGGNTFSLELSDDPPRGRGVHKRKFHGFWDMDTVNALLPDLPETEDKEQRRAQMDEARKKLADTLASTEPANWKMPARMDLTSYAEAWADEILPVAREAHDRALFQNVHPQTEEDRVVATGEAVEKPGGEPGAYRKWASQVVREELHKAGWRLADLLTKALTAPASAAQPQSTPVPR